MRRRQVVIVTDETVAHHHLAPLRASLEEHGIAQRAVVLPPGEGTKDLAHFGRLVDDILAGGVERGGARVGQPTHIRRRARACASLRRHRERPPLR